MKLNKDCPSGVVGYSIPKEFDYMGTSGMWKIKDKLGIDYGAAAYTVYLKGFYASVQEHVFGPGCCS